jgi:hypothetical protein
LQRRSQGDFNYNAVVEAFDLGTLATNWQLSLAPAGSFAGDSLSVRTPLTPLRDTILRSRAKPIAKLINVLDDVE